ncbi:MAG: hypothetical protein HOG90_09095 [Betaproteobacteria bacterium]|jgi:ABC-type transporter Mla maintaining outer membrane lipid asymmetry ATPase subunit MlaF|nr:hypothetical protein [Betaproteobacteria bacterium]
MTVIVKNFRLAFPEKVLFDDLSLDLPDQVICGIESCVLGGTTSLLKGLAGLINGVTGQVVVSGMNIFALTEQERSQTVAIAYEEYGLLSFFNIFQNMVLPLEYHNRLDQVDIVNRLTMLCEMFEFDKQLLVCLPHELNDVQIRLVNLIRALIVSPALCLIDELDSGMHEEMIETAFRGLKEFKRTHDTTMIIATSQDTLLAQMDCAYKIEAHKLKAL